MVTFGVPVASQLSVCYFVIIIIIFYCGYLWSASGIAIECDRPAFCGKSVAAWALVEDVRRNWNCFCYLFV